MLKPDCCTISSMKLLRDVRENSATGVILFAAAATLLALALHFSGDNNSDRLIVRLIIELPILLIAAGVSLLLINMIAGCVASPFGSTLLAGSIAGVCAWLVAGGTPSFAGLGYHWLIRPAFALAAILPWVFGFTLTRLIQTRT